MGPRMTKQDGVVCPLCIGGRYVQFITDDGGSRSEKCPLCRARGRVAMEHLLSALMRLVARFPSRQYTAAYVRSGSGPSGLGRLIDVALGSRTTLKSGGRKAGAPGRIPVSQRGYRRWFQTRVRRGGMDYRRSVPRGHRITLTRGQASWNRGQRRR